MGIVLIFLCLIVYVVGLLDWIEFGNVGVFIYNEKKESVYDCINFKYWNGLFVCGVLKWCFDIDNELVGGV